MNQDDLPEGVQLMPNVGVAFKDHASKFRVENFAHLNEGDLMLAAQFWARNASMMPSNDPWKSHFAMVPIVALLAPNIITLASWLQVAAAAVSHTSGNIYLSCLQELSQQPPPWRGILRKAHEEPHMQHIFRAQMQELLDEIRNDAAISLPGLFRIQGGT